MTQKGYFSAIALFIGTAVGAGIFGLPFVSKEVGFALGAIELVVLAGVLLLITLAYGEVVLRTKKEHQLIGYAGLYLGKTARLAALGALFFGIYSAMIAYTIEVGNFAHAILSPYFGGGNMIYSLVFYGVMTTILVLGIKIVVSVERFMVAFLLFVVIVIVFAGAGEIQLENLQGITPSKALLPFWVILFALAAASAVPTMKKILTKNKKLLKKSIIVGSLVPFLIYLMFTLVVVGVTGESTSESALIGLGERLGPTVLVVGTIFGILSMTTSFISLSFILKESYEQDFRISRKMAAFMVLIVPIAIVLLELVSFIEIIALGGAVLGGMEGILILLMHKEAKKKGQRKPEYTVRFPMPVKIGMYGIFALAILYQISVITGIV